MDPCQNERKMLLNKVLKLAKFDIKMDVFGEQ